MKLIRGLVANLVLPLAIAGALFLLLEGGCRAALRLKTGVWPETQVSAYTRFVEKIGKAYRPHPLLIVAGRPDAVLEAAGHVVHFNARGQRATNVRDVEVPKPEGTYRVECEGGSTTFDLLAPDD
ncbi:MAG: D-(-)-3-hydroxybutyrate oligomer hydrolase, partial [Thermoanaerobaculia bacterium]|nr:D-(-)-3-hydroxybutyrate oligomer hydrolase [Thermoanaerobaculia bacterium]